VYYGGVSMSKKSSICSCMIHINYITSFFLLKKIQYLILKVRDYNHMMKLLCSCVLCPSFVLMKPCLGVRKFHTVYWYFFHDTNEGQSDTLQQIKAELMKVTKLSFMLRRYQNAENYYWMENYGLNIILTWHNFNL